MSTPILQASFGKCFPGVEIRADDLQFSTGVTVLFGPSGSGKTTILRCLAGLERPDAGHISFGGEVWLDVSAGTNLPSRQRAIGFVPQDFALFPHLTVAENVGYGLSQIPAAERKLHVAEALDWLRITDLAGRFPEKLSGGEQQRVALARAIARRPRLLLLDEPLSALDSPTRQRVRSELLSVLQELGAPAVLVTHDRLEAAALGDQIIVVSGGRILQHGTVAEVFNRPASLEVAHLVGTDTILACEVIGSADGLATLAVGNARLTAMAENLPPGAKNVHVCIRAEDVILSRDAESHSSPRNRFVGTVKAMVSEGPFVRLALDCGFPLKALLTRQAAGELSVSPGGSLTVLVKAPNIHVI